MDRREHPEEVPALFPLGYVDLLKMHTMDFEEFLWALGFTEDLTKDIRERVRDRKPFSECILNVLQERFSQFMMVGGMPEAVSAFADKKGIREVGRVQKLILSSFRQSSANCIGSKNPDKILRCIDSIPSQLSGENKKLMWSRIDPGGPGSGMGARTYEEAMFWLRETGFLNCCKRIRAVDRSMSIFRDWAGYKPYVSDTGMLVSLMGPDALAAAYMKDWGFAQGALAENIVAECLMKAGYEPGFYMNRKSPRRMDLDFLAVLGLERAAIEVCSGKHREMSSLSAAVGDDRFDRRISFGTTDIFVDDDGIEHYPLFAAAFVDEMQKPMPEMKPFSLDELWTDPAPAEQGH